MLSLSPSGTGRDDQLLVVDLDPVAGLDAGDVDLIDHGDPSDDGPHGHHRIGFSVDDSRRRQLIARQPIEGVGADGASLSRGKDEDTAGDALALQGMPRLNDEARPRVDAAQEADGLRGDQRLACGVAGFDDAG